MMWAGRYPLLLPHLLLVFLLLQTTTTTTHAFVRRVPPPPPSVDTVISFLNEHIYPNHSSDQRKTLAFKAQDDFLLREQGENALTKTHTTYGEFPLASVHAILQRVNLGPNDVFLDLGSGCGRLTLGVALLFPYLKASLGLECVPALHDLALDAQKQAEVKAKEEGREMAPCRFIQGNVETGEYLVNGENPLAETTALFVYCTTWRSQDGLHLAQPLREALLTHAHPEITIITTDKKFREEEEDDEEVNGHGRGFRVVDRMTVPNPEVFESDVYFHRIIDTTKKRHDTREDD